MDSEASNAERTARYVHDENLKRREEGADLNKKMSCRWFLDRAFYCVSTLLSVCGGEWFPVFNREFSAR